MHTDVLNPRRAPRVPQRCSVEIRDRFAAWKAETEDLGPLGCQLVTPRLAAPGRELQLEIRCEAIGRTIRATGTVVWLRSQEPSRLGIQFQPGRTEAGWFDVLVKADPTAASTVKRIPERLSRAASLYLGDPPRFLGDFSAEEVAVLKRIGTGITVAGLAHQLGSAFERVRGATFALVTRRFLVLSPLEAVAPDRWSAVLLGAEKALAAEGIALPAPTPPGPMGAAGRTAAAQALYDEGINHLTAGRIEVAVARLREAKHLAPADAMITGALERLAPWAS
ncbi:MAG: PilZ domain-containing protein [Anaeromyxobacter sp.]|nr:PilZ domain-containing protein [Anaeromyxobacter sp.]MBL0277014.1 PilZ domain-containing protein [Anaeromyxobacter sp.]